MRCHTLEMFSNWVNGCLWLKIVKEGFCYLVGSICEDRSKVRGLARLSLFLWSLDADCTNNRLWPGCMPTGQLIALLLCKVTTETTDVENEQRAASNNQESAKTKKEIHLKRS